MDELIWVEYKKAEVTLPFPLEGTDLNIIRQAFNFFGGYLQPLEGTSFSFSSFLHPSSIFLHPSSFILYPLSFIFPLCLTSPLPCMHSPFVQGVTIGHTTFIYVILFIIFYISSLVESHCSCSDGLFVFTFHFPLL